MFNYFINGLVRINIVFFWSPKRETLRTHTLIKMDLIIKTLVFPPERRHNLPNKTIYLNLSHILFILTILLIEKKKKLLKILF